MSKAYKINKKNAHATFECFKNLADEYNVTGFNYLSQGMLAAYSSLIKDIIELFAFLANCEDCHETRQALRDAARMEVRLLYLRHYGRVETDKERADFIRNREVKNGTH